MKFHDLVLLLDNHPYDEAVVFARNLDPNDVAACVGACHTARQERDRTGYGVVTTIGFAYGNVWRFLRIEEKLGIVILSDASDPKGPRDLPPGTVRVTDPDTLLLLQALQRAASVSEESAVPTDVLKTDFALLRKQEGILHRNLVMRFDGGNPSGWRTVDSTSSTAFKWVKHRLWSDVPPVGLKDLPEIARGTVEHFDPRNCEFCGVRRAPRKCCRAGREADLAARDQASTTGVGTWTDRHTQCEGCARRSTYKCAPPFDGSACPDRSVARNRYEDGPGDVTSEDCAKLEGICAEPPQPPVDSFYDIAQAKIRRAKELDCYRNLIEQAHEVLAANGASSLMPLAVAKAILLLDRMYDSTAPTEKRCGTCLEGRPYGHDQVRSPCNHYADSPSRPDGPPWENCRFWKPMEKKP